MKQIHELWNSKSGGNMYSYFETKFRALSELYFGKTIYHFEDLFQVLGKKMVQVESL